MTVHPHSSPRTYLIYCVGQELVTINAFKAAMAAAQVPAKPLLGRDKGKSEQSLISRMDDFAVIRPWLNAEESYLHIHSFDARDRPKATLCYLSDGSEAYLGRLVPVARETAMQLEALTYDPTYGQYFVCKQSLKATSAYRSKRPKPAVQLARSMLRCGPPNPPFAATAKPEGARRSGSRTKRTHDTGP